MKRIVSAVLASLFAVAVHAQTAAPAPSAAPAAPACPSRPSATSQSAHDRSAGRHPQSVRRPIGLRISDYAYRTA